MKICIFLHRFDDGGAERTTICLANELKKRGHSISFVVRYSQGIVKKYLDKDIEILDMQLPEHGKIKKNIRNISILTQIMRSGKYDILMAVLTDMSQVASIAKWVSHSSMPLVSIVHSTVSVERSSFQRIRHLLLHFFDYQYSRVVAVSEAVRNDYLKCCRTTQDKVVTIYNPVDTEKIRLMAQRRPKHPWLSQDRNYYTLVLAGRLSYPKNHPMMFEALKELRKTDDFRLILLGEGECKTELISLVEKMNLKESVDFCGYVDNPYGFMRFCDAVVLSSIYEGLPTVLIEALACGSKIVSTDCPSGPAEILGNGKYGILTNPGSWKDMARGIKASLTWEPEKEALLSRAEEFNVQKSVEDYENLFMRIIHENKDLR